MSAATEYVKLIPRIFRNVGKISEGIKNVVKDQFFHLPEDEKQEIERRMGICATCPFMSENAKNNPAMNYKSEREDEHCSLCGCNIILKTSSLLSDCGIAYYNTTKPGKENPLELKWTKYIKPKQDGI